MSLDQAFQLLLFQLSLSLLSVGGVITLASEQHRFLVREQGWMTDAQFQTSITLAQVAPGPNVLFLALWGWHVGLNAAAPTGSPWLTAAAALSGTAICLLGTLVPSSLLTVWVSRFTHRHRQRTGVRALRLGLAPLVVGAMLSTAWLLGQAGSAAAHQKPWLWALSGLSALLVWRTRVHMLVLLAGGATAGWLLQQLSPAAG